MKRSVGLMSVLLSVGFAASAHAKDSGFEVGARLGLGLPLGDAVGSSEDEEDLDFDEDSSSSDKLSEGVSRKIPLQLDVGYRLSPQLMLGGFFQYAFASVGKQLEEGCETEGVSCSARVLRLGLQAMYHFTPITAGSAGWIGGGIGYEWLKLGLEGGDIEFDATIKGFEFLNVQGGYDFVVNDKFRVGPYVLFSLARYASTSLSLSGDAIDELEEEFGEEFQGESQDIDDKAFHGWLSFGVKATFGAL